MKESISYAFLLNIVIIFIFTCAAIIMGVFSYYKAFKANSIIAETIEKYEGYNCLSKEEIATKLGNIGYNTPFKVSCNNRDGKCDDSGEGYKVISYNLDFNGNLVYDNEPMNSTYICDENGCATNKHYQYGIYTYMYFELPVISNLARIPVFSKTSIMYEFRNFYISDYSYSDKEETYNNKHQVSDVEALLDNLYYKTEINDKIYISDAILGKRVKLSSGKETTQINALHFFSSSVLDYYFKASTSGAPTYEELTSYITNDPYNNYRTRAVLEHLKNENSNKLDTQLYSNIIGNGTDSGLARKKCGYLFDYSKIQ